MNGVWGLVIVLAQEKKKKKKRKVIYVVTRRDMCGALDHDPRLSFVRKAVRRGVPKTLTFRAEDPNVIKL